MLSISMYTINIRELLHNIKSGQVILHCIVQKNVCNKFERVPVGMSFV
jgi:hypothetical protein